MAYRSSSSLRYASTASAAVPVPSGAAAGDIADLVLMVESLTTTVTPPAGMTLVGTLDVPAVTSPSVPAYRLHHFTKSLIAADTGTYAFTLSAATSCMGTCVLVSGRVAYDQVAQAATTSAGATQPPSVNFTTSQTTDNVVHNYSWNDNAVGAITGYTYQISVQDGQSVATANAVAGGSQTVQPAAVPTDGRGIIVSALGSSAGPTGPDANQARPARFAPFTAPFQQRVIPFQLLGDRTTPGAPDVRTQTGVCANAAASTGSSAKLAISTGAAATAPATQAVENGAAVTVVDPNQAAPQVAWMFLQPSGASFQMRGDRTTVTVDARSQTGICGTGATSTGTGKKIASPIATNTAAAASTAVEKKVAASTGTSSTAAAITGRQGATGTASELGTTTAAPTAAATERKMAIQTGTCSAGSTARSTHAKVAASLGTTATGAATTRSGVTVRTQTGTCSAGGYTASTARKVSTNTGTTCTAPTTTALPRRIAGQRGTNTTAPTTTVTHGKRVSTRGTTTVATAQTGYQFVGAPITHPTAGAGTTTSGPSARPGTSSGGPYARGGSG